MAGVAVAVGGGPWMVGVTSTVADGVEIASCVWVGAVMETEAEEAVWLKPRQPKRTTRMMKALKVVFIAQSPVKQAANPNMRRCLSDFPIMAYR